MLNCIKAFNRPKSLTFYLMLSTVSKDKTED